MDRCAKIITFGTVLSGPDLIMNPDGAATGVEIMEGVFGAIGGGRAQVANYDCPG